MNEMMAIVSFLERDRGIDREIIVQAIESAILQAAKRTADAEIRVSVDRKTLAINAFYLYRVVEADPAPAGCVSLKRARRNSPDINVGDILEVAMPKSKLGRIAAASAKQIIVQKIREAERKNVYDEYKNRIGELVTGTVRQVIHRDLIVDLDKAEAILQSKDAIPGEDYSVGDPIRAYVYRVQNGANGPSVMLSRACPEFVKKLFRMEVSEIADGIVEIVSIAREAGFRTKLAVKSLDDKIDPVWACVGKGGQRVRNVIRELNGERMDVINWSDDIRKYVTKALAPAILDSIEIDPQKPRTVRCTVEAKNLSLAIGKRGQNVKLASKLTGWKILVEKREEVTFETQVKQQIAELAQSLNVGEDVARTLVNKGFLTVEGIIAAKDPAYLKEVTQLDDATVELVWNAALRSDEDVE